VVYTKDVQSGKTPGTVNHAPNNPVTMSDKEVGKEVSALLEADIISPDDIFEAMVENGIDRMTASEIQDIAEEGDFTRVGKKVAKLIANGSLDKTGFMNMLNTDEEEPERYDYCPDCGAENRWELEEEQTCAKCDYVNEEWLEWQARQEEKELARATSVAAVGVDTNHGQEEDDDQVVCDRCGADLNGDSECPECGYWN
jgi:ribosomal protein L37E